MKPKIILCLALVLSGGLLLDIGFWVINPSISGGPPIHDWMTADQYAQHLRELYPIHLIDPDPAKFVYGRHWADAESGARLGVVVVGFVLIFAVVRFIRLKKHIA